MIEDAVIEISDFLFEYQFESSVHENSFVKVLVVDLFDNEDSVLNFLALKERMHVVQPRVEVRQTVSIGEYESDSMSCLTVLRGPRAAQLKA